MQCHPKQLLTMKNKKDFLYYIQELSKAVSPQYLKKAKTILDYDPKQSKMRQLYEGLRAGKWKTEEEATKALYGDINAKSTFSKLKYDLNELLLHNLSYIDFSAEASNEYLKAKWECRMKYNAAIFLFNVPNFAHIAYIVLDKIIQKSIKYEFTDIIIDCSAMMSWHYKITIGLKESISYEELLWKYLKIQEVELKGQAYLGYIYSQYLKDKSVKSDMPEQCSKFLSELEGIQLSTETQKTKYYKRMIGIAYYMTQYNYTKTAELCEDAIAFFKQQSYFDMARIRAFYFQAIASYAYLRAIARGKELLEEVRPYATYGSYNWFRVQELGALLGFYAEDYQLTYTAYQQVISYSGFKKQPKAIQDHWALVGAYLYVLQSVGKILPNTENPVQFRFATFANEVTIVQRDKKGVGFSMHLLHLFSLLMKKTDKAKDTYIDRMEALRVYSLRYCQNEQMQRSRWICELLIRISDLGFAPKQLRKDAEVVERLHWLRTVPFDITDHNLDVEFIPFQTFFEHCCDTLEMVY